VDYSNDGKGAGFTATDAQTLKVGNEYLANTTLTRAILRNAFGAMFAEDWPIADGATVSDAKIFTQRHKDTKNTEGILRVLCVNSSIVDQRS